MEYITEKEALKNGMFVQLKNGDCYYFYKKTLYKVEFKGKKISIDDISNEDIQYLFKGDGKALTKEFK